MVPVLVSRLKKISLSLLFIPLIHLVLLELFASAFYVVYFVALVFILYLFRLKSVFLSTKTWLFSLIYWLVVYLLLLFFEDGLYDLYIDFNLRFTMSYISYEVCCILTLLHLFILFLLGYNKEKLI